MRWSGVPWRLTRTLEARKGDWFPKKDVTQKSNFLLLPTALGQCSLYYPIRSWTLNREMRISVILDNRKNVRYPVARTHIHENCVDCSCSSSMPYSLYWFRNVFFSEIMWNVDVSPRGRDMMQYRGKRERREK